MKPYLLLLPAALVVAGCSNQTSVPDPLAPYKNVHIIGNKKQSIGSFNYLSKDIDGYTDKQVIVYFNEIPFTSTFNLCADKGVYIANCKSTVSIFPSKNKGVIFNYDLNFYNGSYPARVGSMNILLPSTTTRKMDNLTQYTSAKFSEEQFLESEALEEATFILMKSS
ncbi:hypothetical protein A6D98_05705 [Aliivibrio fischeri]|uniref:hypothetical protein n=1 Tax=Aliivibrio fischeri TaxID=668 RepID=UPI00080E8765|nr:hypothetical protein [Aliivibrio fischeri]OCH62497.1 hypothetical protein A6D98_05705 [Aliivibrio fischeri]